MRRTEIDGVPVFWQQGPAPLSAGLCFAVGRRDESFATGGVTHLVEHLVMGSLPKSHLDHNASVTPKITEFTATGRPDGIVRFLRQVCEALADLPTDRLATEARILAAEEERAGGNVLGHLMLLRYGATGFGLAGMSEPGMTTLTVEDVRGHAERHFVRENAALWLTGPPPEGLGLPLRSAPVPRRAPQRRVSQALPAQARYPGYDAALSFEAPATDAVLCALRMLADRLTDRLRHQGGHSYDVDFTSDAIDADTAHIAFFADAPEKELAAVLAAMVDELRRLVSDGPTAEELAHDLDGMREYFDDPRSAEGAVSSAVARHFDGVPQTDAEARLLEAEQRTPEQVAAALRPALDTLLVLVADAAAGDVLPDLPELPDGTDDTLEGREWRRRLRSDMPRGARLFTSPEGAMLLLKGRQLTVRYDDCVAVGIADVDHRHLELVGAHGLTLPVCEQDWKGGKALLAELEPAVAGLPTYPADTDRPAG